MSVLPNGLTPVLVSAMREGETVCTSVYFTLPEGQSREAAFLDVLMSAAQVAVELDVPVVVEGAASGSQH